MAAVGIQLSVYWARIDDMGFPLLKLLVSIEGRDSSPDGLEARTVWCDNSQRRKPRIGKFESGQ